VQIMRETREVLTGQLNHWMRGSPVCRVGSIRRGMAKVIRDLAGVRSLGSNGEGICSGAWLGYSGPCALIAEESSR
jgi:hypothetical protein